MPTTTNHRQSARRVHLRRLATVGNGAVVSARNPRITRHELSPGARALLASYAPGTVLKVGSAALADADLWTLVLSDDPTSPRAARDAGAR